MYKYSFNIKNKIMIVSILCIPLFACGDNGKDLEGGWVDYRFNDIHLGIHVDFTIHKSPKQKGDANILGWMYAKGPAADMMLINGTVGESKSSYIDGSGYLEWEVDGDKINYYRERDKYNNPLYSCIYEIDASGGRLTFFHPKGGGATCIHIANDETSTLMYRLDSAALNKKYDELRSQP